VRGHGASTIPPDWDVDWAAFGDDTLAAAHHIADHGTITGFGHSMGGAALIMAASREPVLFDSLSLFEPIAHPPTLTEIDIEAFPIVQGARRRRRRFDSYDDAYENFASKPPLSMMVPEALRNYVDHGFRQVSDEDGDGVELCCTPELEAGIFITGRNNGLWKLLDATPTPTAVLAGAVEEGQPSATSAQIAERLPNGRYVELPHMDHFGPFTRPEEVARLVVGN
jgi:pimeloyl-ACP methyl ester carboxylesterase